VEALEGRRPRLAIACLAALLAVGAAARTHGLGRSLWLDEAWVANSVLAPGLAEMLRYEAWLQTSPPLFLILVRGTAALAGDGNLAFRLLPWLFSLASLALFAALAWRWLGAPAALASVALFALSPHVALAGASLKPYASDAFGSLALLAAGAAYLARPSGRRLAASRY
jgi:4-amino-4-deoxy-L-arabinose transferase-like glycosyltransferase